MLRLLAPKDAANAAPVPRSPADLASHGGIQAQRSGAIGRRLRRRWLGIDIGSSAVKIVELSRLRETYRVEAFAIEPVPPGSVVGGNISDANAVGETIRTACRRAGAKATNACLGMRNSAVVTKTIDLDASLTDDELEVEVALEAEKHIPFPIAEVAVDFEPMGLSVRDPAKVDVLVAACRMEHIVQRQQAAEVAGLKARVIDIESHAAQHAITRLGAEGPTALVDIGASASRVVLFADEGTAFVREEALDLGAARGRAGNAASQLPVLIARLTRLAVLASAGQGPKALLLAGGGALLDGLAEQASAQLGKPVALADPFVGMGRAAGIDATELARSAPVLLNACGFALRGHAEVRTGPRTSICCRGVNGDATGSVGSSSPGSGLRRRCRPWSCWPSAPCWTGRRPGRTTATASWWRTSRNWIGASTRSTACAVVGTAPWTSSPRWSGSKAIAMPLCGC